MHLAELSFVDKMIHEKVAPKRTLEWMLATPKILDFVKHNDPDLIASLFECSFGMYAHATTNRYRLIMDFYNAADTGQKPWSLSSQFDLLKETAPDPEDLRDSYWWLLKKIAKQAVKEQSHAVLSWVIDQYMSPEFPHYTKREADKRYRERDKKFYDQFRQPDKRPFPRKSREDNLDHVTDLLVHAIEHLDEDLAVKIAQLIKRHYMRQLNQQKENYDNPSFAGFPAALSSTVLKSSDKLGALKSQMRLIQKIDGLLGTTDTHKRFITSKFMHGLAHDDVSVQDFFISKLSAFKEEEKLELLKERFGFEYLAPEDEGEDDEWRSRDIFFGRHGALLDRFLKVLDQWDQAPDLDEPLYRRTYLAEKARMFAPRSYERERGIFSPHDIEYGFHKKLKWSEISRRLGLLQKEFPNQFHRVTLRRKSYFEAAMERAIKFGHADDFLHLVGMAENFDRVDKANATRMRSDAKRSNSRKRRRRRHGRTYKGIIEYSFYDKVSRGASFLEAVLTYRQKDVKNATEKTPYAYRRFQTIAKMARYVYREDRASEDGCYYYDQGRKIADSDRSASVPQMINLLEHELNALKYKKDRKDLLEEIFGKDEKGKGRSFGSDDYRPISDTLKVIKECKDWDAVFAVTKFWFETAKPHFRIKSKQRQIEHKLASVAFEMWHSWDDPRAIQEFFELIKSHDISVASNMINAARGGQFEFSDRLQAFRVIRLFPELLDDDVKEALKAVERRPANQAVTKHFETLDRNRVKWASAGIGVPETKEAMRHPPTNFDEKLYRRLLPIMNYYIPLDGGGDAAYHAMKLATLFPSVNKASRYLHNHAHGKSPVHDACLFGLPPEGEWDKELWANLAVRWGNGALKWLPRAVEMEAAVAKINENRPKSDMFKLSECKPAELAEFAYQHCAYDRKDENPELSRMLFFNGVAEQYFNESLDLTASFNKLATQGAIPKRDVPDVHIDGAAIGHDGYELVTLPQGDPRNLWMGQFVNSCMHIGNEGHDLALAMFQEPHAAAYVVQRKADSEIVASFHTWMSKAGNIVLNTWQPKTSDHNFLRDAFVRAVGDVTLNAHPTAQRVVLGQGRLEQSDMPYSYIKGSQFFLTDIQDKGGEVNANGGHYTFDTQVGQFVIAERRPTKAKKTLKIK